MSQPEAIKDILPGVMRQIEQRTDRQRQGRVVEAVGDFLAGQRNTARGRRLKARAKHVRE